MYLFKDNVNLDIKGYAKIITDADNLTIPLEGKIMECMYNLLNIENGIKEMICFVGGGGKTSAMFHLSRELSRKGKKILVTTTTAVYYPEKKLFDNIIVSEKEDLGIFDGTICSGITVLGRSMSSEGKLLGVNPEFLDVIFLKGLFDFILIEGDGSKGRSVKAPADHEPVIPSHTTKLVGLVGMDCLEKNVYEENVHRLEHFCRILDCREGDVIDTEMIGKLIIHKQGLFKASPVQSEKYLILNKVDGESTRKSAIDITQQLLKVGFKLEGIVMSSFKGSTFQNAIKEVKV